MYDKQEALCVLLNCNGDINKINEVLNTFKASIVFNAAETAEVLGIRTTEGIKIKNNALRKMKVLAKHLHRY